MFDPDVETASWDEQLKHDDAHFQGQVRYVLARSPFYQRKLKEAGFRTDEEIGGLNSIHELPLTEKDEIRASCTGDNPIGAHLAVPKEDMVRIYSTSGTTGAPSFIPLTAQDLENWVTTSARSYSASGI